MHHKETDVADMDYLPPADKIQELPYETDNKCRKKRYLYSAAAVCRCEKKSINAYYDGRYYFICQNITPAVMI